MIYTIIDIETTGKSQKITEIAIYKHDGQQIIDEFSSLVNPELPIPEHITALTGIDDSMVRNAPLFSEIADRILEFTSDCVFVAHHVNFDYNVMRAEFKNLGRTFKRQKLCTIRLSRRLLPGYPSYSLGKLCKNLDITITDRHRAGGDAQATVILFEKLLQTDTSEAVFKEFLKANSKEATLPAHLSKDVFDSIPNAPGIYYFKNKKSKIIYVGKAKDLKKRVWSHFQDSSTKEQLLCRATADISFELSGNELVALLMEDAAIKTHFPEYNTASKRATKAYAIFTYQDRMGRIHLAYNTLKATPKPLLVCHSITACRSHLEQLCVQFELCPKYCHLQEGVEYCSHHSIESCHGICKQTESVALYNIRVKQAIAHIATHLKNFIVKDTGRHPEEESFILIKDGDYKGYGFVQIPSKLNHIEELDNFLIPQKDNIDIQRILNKIHQRPNLVIF